VRTAAADALTLTAVGANTAAVRIVPIVNMLLGAYSREASPHTMPVGRPLVDNREQVMCGNVIMGKSGSRRRVCRDGNGRVVSTTTSTSDDEGY
jgi:hypothetical protein